VQSVETPILPRVMADIGEAATRFTVQTVYPTDNTSPKHWIDRERHGFMEAIIEGGPRFPFTASSVGSDDR